MIQMMCDIRRYDCGEFDYNRSRKWNSEGQTDVGALGPNFPRAPMVLHPPVTPRTLGRRSNTLIYLQSAHGVVTFFNSFPLKTLLMFTNVRIWGKKLTTSLWGSGPQTMVLVQYIQQSRMTQTIQQKLKAFVDTTKVNKQYKKALAVMQGHFKESRVKELALLKPNDIIEMMQALKARERAPKRQTARKNAYQASLGSTRWKSFEFKVFQWLCCCLSYANDSDYLQFNTDQSEFLKELFSEKDPRFVDYQMELLSRQSGSRVWPWEDSEDETLLQVERELELSRSKWSEVAFFLFVRSEGRFVRQSHICRERWQNHLNRLINKGSWSAQEDLEMIETALQVGTKWMHIAKALKNTRTEHMVKNRMRTLLKSHRLPPNDKGLTELRKILLSAPPQVKSEPFDEIKVEEKEIRMLQESDKDKEEDIVDAVFEGKLSEEEALPTKEVEEICVGNLVEWKMDYDMDSFDLVDLSCQNFREVSRVELLLKAEELERKEQPSASYQ